MLMLGWDGGEVKRCSGHCCSDFTLEFSPEEIRMKALKIRKAPDSEWKRSLLEIARMLIFLRFDKQEPGWRKPAGATRYHYTCKNFDPVTRNCMNYENRPSMCSDYPYGRSCAYKGCTRVCAPKIAWNQQSHWIHGDMKMQKEKDEAAPKQEDLCQSKPTTN